MDVDGLRERIREIDPRAILLPRIELASALGVDLNTLDAIISDTAARIADAARALGARTVHAAFVGGYVPTIDITYGKRRGWDEWMAFREFLQNALDTGAFTGIGRAEPYTYVADNGPGMKPSNVLYVGASTKDICRDRGIFGEGTKVAMITLLTYGMPTTIFTVLGNTPVLAYTYIEDRRLPAILFATYMLDADTAIDTPLDSIAAYGGTLVAVYDPENRIEQALARRGLRGIREAVAYTSSEHVTAITQPPAESVFSACGNTAVEMVLLDRPDRLYVRDIYVNTVSSQVNTNSIFGYNVWWVRLDPNRNNVMSVDELMDDLRRLYAQLTATNKLAEKIADALVNIVRREQVAGTLTVIKLDVTQLLEAQLMFYNADLAWHVIDRLQEKLGVKIDTYAVKPSHTLLTLYAHLAAERTLLAIETPWYMRESVIHNALRHKLLYINDVVKQHIKELEERVGYSKSVIPDAPVVSALLSALAGMIVNSDVRVGFTVGTSFADVSSGKIFLTQNLVSINATKLTIRRLFKVFIHEVAHIYARKYYGEYADLTEQHVEAIQTIASLLLTDEELLYMAKHVEKYLMNRIYLERAPLLTNMPPTFTTRMERIAYLLGVAGEDVVEYPPSEVALYAAQWAAEELRGQPYSNIKTIVLSALGNKAVVASVIPITAERYFTGSINYDFPRLYTRALALYYLTNPSFGNQLLAEIISGITDYSVDDVIDLADEMKALAERALMRLSEEKIAAESLAAAARNVIRRINELTRTLGHI